MGQVLDVRLTASGRQQLREELAVLNRQREALLAEYARALKAATDERCDEPALSELALLDSRIAQIQLALERAVIVKAEEQPGKATVGSRVRVRWEDGEEEGYVIVSPPEADPRTARISYESPVGSALMGRRVGDEVEVTTPGGPTRVRLLDVA